MAATPRRNWQGWTGWGGGGGGVSVPRVPRPPPLLSRGGGGCPDGPPHPGDVEALRPPSGNPRVPAASPTGCRVPFPPPLPHPGLPASGADRASGLTRPRYPPPPPHPPTPEGEASAWPKHSGHPWAGRRPPGSGSCHRPAPGGGGQRRGLGRAGPGKGGGGGGRITCRRAAGPVAGQSCWSGSGIPGLRRQALVQPCFSLGRLGLL